MSLVSWIAEGTEVDRSRAKLSTGEGGGRSAGEAWVRGAWRAKGESDPRHISWLFPAHPKDPGERRSSPGDMEVPLVSTLQSEHCWLVACPVDLFL